MTDVGSRSNWLLLMIAIAESDGLTPIQLQKALFLLGDKCRGLVGTDFYEFKPWDYGPFDPMVYDDARDLETGGFVSIVPDPGQRWSRYTITGKGAEIAKCLKPQLPAAAIGYAQAVVDWVKPLTFVELARAIFKAYPEMAKNAVFQGTY